MPRTLKKPWLDSFLEYVQELESPDDYKLWCGISAIGSSMKKKVFLKRGFYKIYPNMYIILVGAPGIGKGTSINPAVELVKKAGTANYLSDRITAERMLERLQNGFPHPTIVGTSGTTGQVVQVVGDTTATIISTELPVFLGTSDWMIPLLCEMWERGEFNYDTKTKGTISATGLCVSLVGACVPDYIRNLSKDSTAFITSGFSSRCIFVFSGHRGTPVAWPSMNGNLSVIEQSLIDDLKAMALLTGEFKLTQDAFTLWEDFYKNSLQVNEFESDIVTSFKARMVSHVLKTAMILSISEKDDLLITRDNLYNSIALINKIKEKLDIAFRSIGDSPLAVGQDRILRYIEKYKKVTFSQVFKDNMRHITYEDLIKVLGNLKLAGIVNEDLQNNKPYYTLTKKGMGATSGN